MDANDLKNNIGYASLSVNVYFKNRLRLDDSFLLNFLFYYNYGDLNIVSIFGHLNYVIKNIASLKKKQLIENINKAIFFISESLIDGTLKNLKITNGQVGANNFINQSVDEKLILQFYNLQNKHLINSLNNLFFINKKDFYRIKNYFFKKDQFKFKLKLVSIFI